MALWDNLIDYSYGDQGDLSSWDTPSTYSPVPQGLGFDAGLYDSLLSALPAFGASAPAPAAAPAATSSGISPMQMQQLIAAMGNGSGGGGRGGFLSQLGIPGFGSNNIGGQGPVGDFQQNLLSSLKAFGSSFLSDNPTSGILSLLTQGFGDIRQGDYGSGIGDILLGPLGGLLGGEIQSLFTGRPHTQATQQSAQTLAGQGDPVERYLGRLIGGAAGNNRVLSESSGGSSLETESGTLADVLQILGNYTLPGLGGSQGFQLPGAPSVGVLPLGRSYGNVNEPSALSPTAYQQKFGFGTPSSSELSAFLSSPYAPTAAQGQGGIPGALSSVLGDFRSFLGAGGGSAGTPGAAQSANAGLSTSGVVPGGGVAPLTGFGGGMDLSSLLQSLGQGGGNNNLMQQIQKAIQRAIGSAQPQQSGPQTPPWQQGPDPWNISEFGHM